MMFWYGNGGGWAWWQAALTWAGMIAFWALLVWLVYVLFRGAARRTGEPERGGPQTPDARRILDERLARGEIDPDEYRRLGKVLEGQAAYSPVGTESRR